MIKSHLSYSNDFEASTKDVDLSENSITWKMEQD